MTDDAVCQECNVGMCSSRSHRSASEAKENCHFSPGVLRALDGEKIFSIDAGCWQPVLQVSGKRLSPPS